MPSRRAPSITCDLRSAARQISSSAQNEADADAPAAPTLRTAITWGVVLLWIYVLASHDYRVSNRQPSPRAEVVARRCFSAATAAKLTARRHRRRALSTAPNARARARAAAATRDATGDALADAKGCEIPTKCKPCVRRKSCKAAARHRRALRVVRVAAALRRVHQGQPDLPVPRRGARRRRLPRRRALPGRLRLWRRERRGKPATPTKRPPAADRDAGTPPLLRPLLAPDAPEAPTTRRPPTMTRSRSGGKRRRRRLRSARCWATGGSARSTAAARGTRR